MKVFKCTRCDKCGKEYDADKNMAEVMYVNYELLNKNTYDLCSDCAKDFEKWFKE